MDEVPELPEWIQTLIQNARDDGYTEGIETGRRYAWQDIKRAIESAGKWYL